MKLKISFSLLCALPFVVFAYSTGPPVQRTGATVDGGLNCTVCHSNLGPANSDARGSVTIAAANYTPGVPQVITVSVAHPQQRRWGFQLIARTASDQTRQAGTFSVDSMVRVRCLFGDAPCNGGPEFAEHQNAPQTGVGAGFTFNITWTPPASAVGDVIFYAAGNAANGDGTSSGDHIYTTSKSIASNSNCTLTQTPAIAAVANGASFLPTIGPGAMISLFGTHFESGATTPFTVSGADLVSNAFPRKFACLAVEINGTRVPLAFASDGQINAQAPYNLPAGTAQVRVLANPDQANQLASDPFTVTVQPESPGFFLFGKGAVAATVANSATPIADPAAIPGAVAAKPGDVVTLWITGLGQTNPAVSEGAVTSAIATVNAALSLTLGGVTVPAADVLYAGVSPGSISGLYQMNVRVPSSLPDGRASVALQVNGTPTPDGLSIPIQH